MDDSTLQAKAKASLVSSNKTTLLVTMTVIVIAVAVYFIVKKVKH